MIRVRTESHPPNLSVYNCFGGETSMLNWVYEGYGRWLSATNVYSSHVFIESGQARKPSNDLHNVRQSDVKSLKTLPRMHFTTSIIALSFFGKQR